MRRILSSEAQAKLEHAAAGVLTALSLRKHGSKYFHEYGSVDLGMIAASVSEADIDDFIKYLRAVITLYRTTVDVENFKSLASDCKLAREKLHEIEHSAEYKFGQAFKELMDKANNGNTKD